MTLHIYPHIRNHAFYQVYALIFLFLLILYPAILQAADNGSSAVQVHAVHAEDSSPNPDKVTESWHPPHVVKVWTTSHKGRIFRVTQLPRCEHLEMKIAYTPQGETVKQAQRRLGGVAAMSGSFHHPQTYSLADFLQRNGSVLSAARTGRHYLAANTDGSLSISGDYTSIKGKPDISALALGQRLVPLRRDGFSLAFMNKVTDRMAVGMNNNFLFIVQGKSDIWKLAHFMEHKLPVNVAVNSDGGHVVRGVAPVHVVFRWKISESILL